MDSASPRAPHPLFLTDLLLCILPARPAPLPPPPALSLSTSFMPVASCPGTWTALRGKTLRPPPAHPPRFVSTPSPPSPLSLSLSLSLSRSPSLSLFLSIALLLSCSLGRLVSNPSLRSSPRHKEHGMLWEGSAAPSRPPFLKTAPALNPSASSCSSCSASAAASASSRLLRLRRRLRLLLLVLLLRLLLRLLLLLLLLQLRLLLLLRRRQACGSLCCKIVFGVLVEGLREFMSGEGGSHISFGLVNLMPVLSSLVGAGNFNHAVDG